MPSYVINIDPSNCLLALGGLAAAVYLVKNRSSDVPSNQVPVVLDVARNLFRPVFFQILSIDDVVVTRHAQNLTLRNMNVSTDVLPSGPVRSRFILEMIGIGAARGVLIVQVPLRSMLQVHTTILEEMVPARRQYRVVFDHSHRIILC